jgi:dipeptidyl aminopeptidase/acylaminoacyl peptidase
LEHGNLWVWEEGGAPRQISSSGDITEQRLSPDGQRIAYLRQVGEARVELWAVDGSGENPHLLVDSAAFAGMRPAMRTERRRAGIVPYGLAWLPGRHVLAFNTRPLFPEERDFVPDDLWLVNADNLYLSNLLPAGQGGAFSYSPDGRTIALLTPSRLDLVNADGSNRRPDVLPGYHSTGTGLEEVFPKPAWAPDSRSFKIALPAPENAQDPIPRVDLWELPLPGFIESLDRTIQGFPSSVVFSPDLLFSAYWRWSDPQAAGREIHLAGVIQATATPTGQATPEVTPTPDPSAADYLYSAGPPLEFLGWSPDSRSFALWDSQAHRLYAGGICAVPTLLADGLPSLGLLYWQDAQTVLFVTGTEGAWQLRRVTSGQPAQILLELGASAGFDFALLPEK